MTALLEARGICKNYGHVEVLREVDFAVNAGEVTALIGDNGAGKSTLVKILSGTIPLDRGTILLEGKPITMSGATLYYFDDRGRITGHWQVADRLSIYQQLQHARGA